MRRSHRVARDAKRPFNFMKLPLSREIAGKWQNPQKGLVYLGHQALDRGAEGGRRRRRGGPEGGEGRGARRRAARGGERRRRVGLRLGDGVEDVVARALEDGSDAREEAPEAEAVGVDDRGRERVERRGVFGVACVRLEPSRAKKKGARA